MLGCRYRIGGGFSPGRCSEMGMDRVGAGTCPDGVPEQIIFVQILLLLLGVPRAFFGALLHYLAMAVPYCSGMFNSNSEGIMVTLNIGKHTVEIYDTIDELPIVRFHKYQKLLLVDSGVGADISAFDQRLERARRFIALGNTEKAEQELQNLRQCVFLIQSEINPRHRAFAALVAKIDGEPCNDLSDDALAAVTAKLQDVPESELTARLDAVKKKIDEELMVYFPSLFNDSEVKEYYDLLRKRTLAVLEAIVAGEQEPARNKAVDKLTTLLITYSNPKTFSGPESAEIQFDRQFENLCLVLSEQLHVRPKEYTVLEFYNAFDFVREKAKESEKALKRANSGR